MFDSRTDTHPRIDCLNAESLAVQIGVSSETADSKAKSHMSISSSGFLLWVFVYETSFFDDPQLALMTVASDAFFFLFVSYILASAR